jgi:EpsI family protein
MNRIIDHPVGRILVTAVIVVFCYADVLTTLVKQWTENSKYSYGFAVPLISAYVVWTKWTTLRRLPVTQDYARGAALVLMGLVMLSVGRLGGLMSLQALSLLVTLSGLMLFLMGSRVIRALRFPLAYLLLAMPVWDYLFASIQLPGQRAAATMATVLLKVAGVPALHHGTTIDLPNVSLEVMAECSGINQLLALTTMAIPAAYLWIDTGLRRTCLVLIAIVLGYLSNGLRVAILGWLTWQGYLVSDPHTVIHLAPGFFSVGLAYLVLGACLTWLSKTNEKENGTVIEMPGALPHVPVARRLSAEFGMLVLMLCAGASQLVAMPEVESPPSAMPTVPAEVSGWQMESAALSGVLRFAGFDEKLLHLYPSPTGERRFAGVDEELLRTYRNDAGTRVHLYVGYYWSQAEGKELTGDVGRALQTAGSPVSLALGNATTVLREVVQQREQGPRGVLFWYVVNDRVTSNIYVAKLYTLWEAMTKWRTGGAVVMVAWDAAETAPNRARAAALDFAGALLAQPRPRPGDGL